MSIDDALFGQTYSQLMSKVAGDNPNFQLLTPAVPWWWDTAPTGQISRQAYQFVNAIPQWSAVGAYSPTGDTVTTAYATLLQFVNLAVPPDAVQRATDAHNAMIAASNQFQTDTSGRNTAWTTMLNNQPPGVPAPDFTTWAQQSGWTGTLAKDSAAVAKAQETYAEIVAQQNPTYKAAVDATIAPAKGATKPGWTLMDQGDGNLVPMPNWQIGTTGQDWVALLSKGGNATTVSVSADKGGYDWTQSWAKGSASIGVPYFSLEVSGSWQQMSLAENDSSVTVEVTLAASALVPVTADPSWYDSGYLKALGENPSGFNPPYTPTGGSSPVFGEGGILPLVVSGLVVGYQPSITVSMSSDTFDQHTSQWEAAAGVRIGPWVFGEGSGGSSSDSWTSDSASNTFTTKSTATYPFILGVVVAHPGLD